MTTMDGESRDIDPLPAFAGSYPNCPACGKQAGVLRDHIRPDSLGHCREHGAFHPGGEFVKVIEVAGLGPVLVPGARAVNSGRLASTG